MDIEDHYRDWLTLFQADGLGPVSILQLLEIFHTPQNILSATVNALEKAGLSSASINSLSNPDERMIESSFKWLDRPDHHLVTYFDSDYPALLKSIYAAPPLFFAAGNRSALKAVQFSIVGSRNPTRSGKALAQDFACELSRTGFSICSGLALGIDYHSHLGSLDASGITVAVLGNGPDIIYPSRHRGIAEQIKQNGLLISEFLLGTKPTPGNFPRRNRLISGISTGVLVVEAAKKSGSLITANYALEQGREVFAIPGSIHNPLARGTNFLIQQGAKLVETIEDILQELGSTVDWVMESKPNVKLNYGQVFRLDPECEILLDNIGYDVMSVDELVRSSGLTAKTVSSMLLMLELQGVVESRQGGLYCRCT